MKNARSSISRNKSADKVTSELLEYLESRMPYLLQQFPEFDQVTFTEFAEADPSGDKYVAWIAGQVRAGNAVFPEDAGKVKELLTEFERLKRLKQFSGEKDINKYDLPSLYKTIDANRGVRGEREKVRINQQKGVKLAGETGNLKVYAVTNNDACAAMFRHTNWCVKDPKYAKLYLESGPLYLVTKNEQPYVLASMSKQSVMDTADAPIDTATAQEIAPLLKRFVRDRGGVPGTSGPGGTDWYLLSREHAVAQQIFFINERRLREGKSSVEPDKFQKAFRGGTDQVPGDGFVRVMSVIYGKNYPPIDWEKVEKLYAAELREHQNYLERKRKS